MAANDEGSPEGSTGYRPPDALADSALHAEGRRLEGRASLEARVETIAAQVEALDAQITNSRRHWYRDAASLVAVLALMFSFGTTFVSLERAAQQDRHDKKVELLSLIDRLSGITRDFADAQSTFRNDPSTLSTLSSVLNQQQLLAAEQAASIMEEIPGDVNAAEYVFVANILVANGLDIPGLDLLQKGIDTATNANDRVGALRSKAVRHYQIGEFDEGRGLFRLALDVFTQFPNKSAAYVAYTHLQTQQGWATAELFAGQCGEAKVHLDAARELASQFDSTDSRVQQVAALVPLVAACKPGTPAPSPSAPQLLPAPSSS